MIGRERIRAMFEGSPADRVGYWSGSPHPDTAVRFRRELSVHGDIELAIALGDDAVWMPAEWDCWQHPEGQPVWPTPDAGDWIDIESKVLSQATTVTEVEEYPWPDPRFFDFAEIEQDMICAHRKGLAIFGGPWCSMSTVLMGLFGTEEFLIKLHTHPEVVRAAIEYVVSFYERAVHRFFQEVSEYPEVFFFASDLGSQEDLILSPEMFRRFLLPALSRIAEVGKSYGLPVMLHSCGSIAKIIPDIITIGVDGLHPLQARARGMSADELTVYRDDLVFVGGVDTQELLPFGSPEEVEAEVERLKSCFGERFVVSPSHEALLPNVPLENVLAMRRGAVANPHWHNIAGVELVAQAVGA